MDKIFGKKLKELRIKKNISQSVLAKKSKFEPSAISHFENNTRYPTVKNVWKLADTLNVSIDYLVGRDKDIIKGNITPKTLSLVEYCSKLNDFDFNLLIEMADKMGKRDDY